MPVLLAAALIVPSQSMGQKKKKKKEEEEKYVFTKINEVATTPVKSQEIMEKLGL